MKVHDKSEDLNILTSPAPTILIVEDDEVTLYMLEFLLQREGYSVTSAKNGKEASRIIDESKPFDLVLLDIMIPYINGFELVTYIRSLPDWKDTAVFMLSGKSQEKDIIRALDSGATDYIVKPFQPGEVLARIRKFTNTSS